jgi:long-chain acyl-CoA synthetase
VNIFQVIKEETGNFPDKAAVVDGEDTFSYKQLIAAVDMIAADLQKRGVRQFQRVCLLCDDNIDYITLSLAILSLSAVVVPVSPEHTQAEIDDVIVKISVDMLIFAKGLYSDDGAHIFQSKSLCKNIYYCRIREIAEKPCSEYYGMNPAFIRFSSGTTGASKGIVLSHEGIIERTDAADKGMHITQDDTILWVLSMSFHFVVSILLFLRRAATIVLCRSRFPESFIAQLTKSEGNVLYASPFHYKMLASSELLSQESLRHVRMAVSTAIKLSDTVADAFASKFGFELAEAYGIIEVGLPFINLSADRRKRGSVGRALPDYRLTLLDKDTDGVGEICIQGKGMLEAYFSPWQNRKSILKDGWFCTGDFGKIDEDGFLTIAGRKKNVINFAGMKVFPDEVETVLNQHPLIEESMVYDAPHPVYGQLPIAKIVMKDSLKQDIDVENLRRFCYQRLAQYKVPKEFICVDQLPKTASGKIRR